VYNHAGYGTRYLGDPRTRGWLRSSERGDCGEDDLTQCVSGLPDWKTEDPEVARWLLDAQLEWARRSGVDGFRLDTVKHVAHPFWQEHRRRTRAELAPGFFLLGEVWGGDREVLDPWFAGDELDAGFDFGFQGSALAFVQGRGRTVAFDRFLASREKVRPGHHLAHYLSSHDVPGALFQLDGRKDLFRLAAVLQMTSGGIPVVYYGEEVGRPGGDWPANRSDMPWGDHPILPGKGLPRDEGLRDFYRRLIAVRRAHPALSRGAHQGLATEGDLYVFSRRDPASGDAVVVAVNRGETPTTATFSPPAEWRGAAAVDLLGGSGVRCAEARCELAVGARDAAVVGVRAPR
jgi:alpha-amylase